MSVEDIIRELRTGRILNRHKLDSVKKKFSDGRIVQNSEIIKLLSDDERIMFKGLLRKKPSRSASGVSVVAVMCKPGKCPHGRCVMCPSINNVPQSYTGDEPAARRAVLNNFDPYKQVFERLKQYIATGHVPSKVELIILGGTFLSFDRVYKEQFISRCYQALNDFPGYVSECKPLDIVIKENETARVRCVALVVETRPDCFDVDELLSYGCTRVELGVQNLDDVILDNIERGHSIASVIKATKTLRDAGFKVDYHMMLGLPLATVKSDVEMFTTLFSDSRFQPDGLKIYPTLVIKGTKLYDWFSEGKYTPITDDYVVSILLRIKPLIPEYVRIKRVMRDIPSPRVFIGPKSTNLRELVWSKVACRCIRCREVGRIRNIGDINLKVREYTAGNGREFFISFESDTALIGFCRLRIFDNKAIIRELHVYGTQVPINSRSDSFQHRGYGRKLLDKAESICLSNNINRLSVLSGVGAREYYRMLDYNLEDYYMVKLLK